MQLSGELSTEEFQRKKQQLKDRQYEIARLIKVCEEADDKFTDTATMLITLASQGHETFKGSESPQKRKIINFIFQNLKLRGKKLQTSLRFPFDIFKKTTTCTKMAGRSGQFQNHDRHKIISHSNAKSLLLSRSVKKAVDLRDNTCLWLKIISKSIRFVPYFVQNLMDSQNF